MKDQMKISEDITSSRQPSQEEIKKLPQQGFKSVVNLRASEEEDMPFSPQEEGEFVRESGMEYLNIPISPKEGPKSEQVDQFRSETEHLPKPIFIHCHTGKRSGALAMIYLALKEGLTGEEALQKAESMGFECNVPGLKEFFINYINQNTMAGKR
ncbi:MAG: Zn-dependent hydrolase [Candidatus Jettenia ecosi]|uniref:Zn-dependent hydrolase n=1 Tax=Candidatus Jettenia ecosi TaxID=2494326 RepID=A0A533QEL0_9BACT|nr:MAG: Zn-dependent hydrolase [Candidatus Jettenia ecosi]